MYEVSRVIKHPQFSMRHLRHDVAVLKLARAANLDNKVGTVRPPKQNSRVSQETTCYVTGKLYDVRLTHFCCMVHIIVVQLKKANISFQYTLQILCNAFHGAFMINLLP